MGLCEKVGLGGAMYVDPGSGDHYSVHGVTTKNHFQSSSIVVGWHDGGGKPGSGRLRKS